MQSVCYVIAKDHPLQRLYEHMNAVFILIEFYNKKVSEKKQAGLRGLGNKHSSIKTI